MQTHHNANNDGRLAHFARQHGKAGWLFLWLLGVPVPVLVTLFLIRGCT